MNRLASGTALLVSRYCVWLWADGIKAGLVRLAGGLAAVGFIGGVCLAAPGLLAPVAAAWCLGAWYTGRPDASDGDDETGDAPDGEDELDFLTLLHDLMADADRIHLAQVAEHVFGDPDATATVREACAAAGVPITRGVRVPGRAVSTGLYRRDLPPLPDHSPTDPVAVVGAGQDKQQQQQHPDREGFVVLPDRDGNPARHEVHWITEPVRKAS